MVCFRTVLPEDYFTRLILPLKPAFFSFFLSFLNSLFDMVFLILMMDFLLSLLNAPFFATTCFAFLALMVILTFFYVVVFQAFFLIVSLQVEPSSTSSLLILDLLKALVLITKLTPFSGFSFRRVT